MNQDKKRALKSLRLRTLTTLEEKVLRMRYGLVGRPETPVGQSCELDEGSRNTTEVQRLEQRLLSNGHQRGTKLPRTR